MEYRRCGRSGLKLPALSLGGWHNFSDPQRARELMVRAFDLGITHFDLANNYGPPAGAAETSVGQVLHGDFTAHRDELIISSKAGYYMWPGPYGEWGSKKYLMASLDQSLARMKLDYVDIFYSHRFDPQTPLEETLGALDLAVKQGKALYVGISSYSGAATVESYHLLRGMGTPLTIHQPAYNMFNRSIESDLLPHTQRLGVGIIAFCPLAQGLLSEKYLAGIPKDSRAASESGFLKREQVTDEVVAKVRQLKAVAQERGQSVSQLALSWLLKDERVTSVLFGASRVSQIEENVKVVNAAPISDEHAERIERILNG